MSSLILMVNFVFSILGLLILARVIISWLPMAGVQVDPYNPVIRLIFDVTDPILNPFRRYLTFSSIDFSPLIALLVLRIIQQVLMELIRVSFGY